MLKSALGKNGLLLQAFALGLDSSPVMPVTASAAIKSIGNSTTTPKDIKTADDAKCVYFLLAESVAARLREHGFRTQCVNISARTTELFTASCQTMLRTPTDITGEIAEAAVQLFAAHFVQNLPLRSVGISCSHLTPTKAPMQLSFADDPTARMKKEHLDQAIDDLRRRYGHNVVQRGVVAANTFFSMLKPKEDHVIHPVPFWAG